MSYSYTSTKAKNNFGELIDIVRTEKESVTITRKGIPVAVLTPYNSQYEDLDKAAPLTLNDAEYKKVKEGIEKFRNDFKFSF